ncbi:hypothetical protein CkaCkLH20_00742 [Colletotrichum karsti]|uniref:Uncharacterized protein n=1 Tax=Colletotrichum karsti TaxID=1095194 RepID=A0A9P6LQF0_9PEZI|nr:uncharacterized protein CkaCkLH20_00742 [Colletotrichum karsti]KAF9881596.1 hypothetical protein CkaCkLH20_00742 [Colletotrichum karsti]
MARTLPPAASHLVISSAGRSIRVFRLCLGQTEQIPQSLNSNDTTCPAEIASTPQTQFILNLMCEDGKSERTADTVASSRVQPPSASGRSGRSSRLPSPDAVLSDPDFAPGRRVTRSFLAESLMDMRIPPRATPPPRLGKKRGIDEVVDDSTPPSPDKLLRELDQQHQEAKKAGQRTVAQSLPKNEKPQAQGQDKKRQKQLAIRGSNPSRVAAPTSAGHQYNDGNGNPRRPGSSSELPKG